MATKEPETEIEKHYIGGQGDLLAFVRQSKDYGAYLLSDSDIIGYLKKAASIEDKDARDLVTQVVGKLEYMNKEGAELRRRFATTHAALEKINDTLKSRAEKDNS